MPLTITVDESLIVDRAPEIVWDFTQDFSRRTTWDPAVRRARVISATPVPRVEVHGQAGFKTVLQYKQFDRPTRTSLAMQETRSPLIVGGGGSWSYEPAATGTLWRQSNALLLKDGWMAKMAAPLLRWQFRRVTRQAMRRAKDLIERG